MSSVPPLENTPEPTTPDPEWDLDDRSLYLNRELTWLAFNRRVLTEAENPDNPLLERLKFLSIFDSNLDEFFMKRMGGLKQQLGAGLRTLSIDGRTPREQLDACRRQVIDDLADRVLILRELLEGLSEEGIRIEAWKDLDSITRPALRRQYRKMVLPLVTPLAIDEAHPFPFVSNLSINLLVEIHDPTEDEPHLVRIKAPISDYSPRFMQIGAEPRFVRIEDVILNNLDLLLPGARVLSAGFFRVTRNAIVERDEETANDLIEMIEAELRDRQFAPVVRLEVSPSLAPPLRRHLVKELKCSGTEDIFEVPDILGVRDLMQLLSLDRPDLKDPVHTPVEPPRLARAQSVFDELDANGPILLQHPYQSFDLSVIRMLREAVVDPHVLAIKTTLYRTSEESEIVPLLIEAVELGKQVAVAVELQARFDEAANIRWANRLEEAGIHVSYGVFGYKTHTKAMLILRRKPKGGLKRYVHIGTGNYNSTTARLYSDLGLLTSDKIIGADATEIFNLMTSGSMSGRRYTELLVSPLTMKPRLLHLIEREIQHHDERGDGVIQLKTNALEDIDIVRALYKATQAGVQVDLIIRDSCRLRPGLPGLSESARVVSVVGRFLEHARLYYFRNGGSEEYYIGSADLMTRNLESRVEVLTPIKAVEMMDELRTFIDLQLEGRAGAWEMNSDGAYEMWEAESADIHSQLELVERIRNQSSSGTSSSQKRP
jgi:polyphosphate kinase